MRNRSIVTPCFQVNFCNRKRSDQQRLLLALERIEAEVDYVAPAFHAFDEFSDAYLLQKVLQIWILFEPSVVGELTDDEDHYVVFDHRRSLYLFPIVFEQAI